MIDDRASGNSLGAGSKSISVATALVLAVDTKGFPEFRVWRWVEAYQCGLINRDAAILGIVHEQQKL